MKGVSTGMQGRALVGITAALLPLAGCATLNQTLQGLVQKPEAELVQVHLRDFSFESVTMDFEMKVTNPNPVGISLAGMDYQLDLDGKRFVAGETQESLRIAAQSDSTVKLPLQIAFADFVDNLATLFSSREEVPYAFQTGLQLDTPGGAIRLPLSKDGQLPLPKLPEIEVADVNLASINLTGARVEVDVSLKNKGKFPVKPRGFAYDLGLAGVSISSGEQAIPDLAADAVHHMKIPVNVSFLSLGASAAKAFYDKKLPYSVEGTLDLGVLKQPFSLSGTAEL